MNFLAIYPSEFNGSSKAFLIGKRAEYAIEKHELIQGITISALIINGNHYKATVEKIVGNREVHLKLDDLKVSLLPIPINLIVAVPRPQTLRKVLQYSASFGVKTLNLIRTENVVKSYLTSKRLEQDAIEEDLLLGIEQSGSCYFPKVNFYATFRNFLDSFSNLISYNQPYLGFIADTHEKDYVDLKTYTFQTPQDIFIAIGPESGFNQYEVSCFSKLNFKVISLGQRIQRVETACVSLLSQINLLRGETLTTSHDGIKVWG